jgi:hypothetical protein
MTPNFNSNPRPTADHPMPRERDPEHQAHVLVRIILDQYPLDVALQIVGRAHNLLIRRKYEAQLRTYRDTGTE